MSDFPDYRRELAGLDTASSRHLPQIQRDPPTAVPGSPSQVAPWLTGRPAPLPMPPSVFQGSFYNDDSDAQSPSSQRSPSARPATGRTGSIDSPDVGYFGAVDERRPSVVSTATTGSTGSKGSASKTGFHKKLQGFFGDDFAGRDGSDSSLPPGIGKEQASQPHARTFRKRNASVVSNHSVKDPSPETSRPRTPVPTSDVVPFLYQEAEVCGDFEKCCALV